MPSDESSAGVVRKCCWGWACILAGLLWVALLGMRNAVRAISR